MQSYEWSKEKYYSFLLDNECIGFHEQGIKLKSGRLSPFYANLRILTDTTEKAKELASYIINFSKDKGIIDDPNILFYGVPEGATKAGFFAQLQLIQNYKMAQPYILSDNTSFKNQPLLYPLSHLEAIASLILDRLEKEKLEIKAIDTIYGDPKTIYREVSLLLGAKCYEKYKKDYYLVLGRIKPKSHGLARDRYFIGKPKGNVLILAHNEQRAEELEKQVREIEDIKQIYKVVINAEMHYHKPSIPAYNIILIEDVTTTGGSAIKEVKNMLSMGFSVKGVIALFNRNEINEEGTTIEEELNKLGVSYYAMANALDLLPEAAKRKKIDKEMIEKVISYYKKYGAHDKEGIRKIPIF